MRPEGLLERTQALPAGKIPLAWMVGDVQLHAKLKATLELRLG